MHGSAGAIALPMEEYEAPHPDPLPTSRGEGEMSQTTLLGEPAVAPQKLDRPPIRCAHPD